MRHLGRIRFPVAVAWSVGDSPEFRRQGTGPPAALQGMGRLAGGAEIFSANHFEEPRQLADPDSPLSRVLPFSLMGIASEQARERLPVAFGEAIAIPVASLSTSRMPPRSTETMAALSAANSQ